MARVEFDVETKLPPQEVIDLLVDFSPRRPDRWPGLAPQQYQVYSVSDTSADVREGGPPQVWARERYDWATPGTVRWEVVESNMAKPGSYVQATVRENGSGGSTVHVEWQRTPANLPAALMLGMCVVTRGAPVKASLAAGFKRALAARAG